MKNRTLTLSIVLVAMIMAVSCNNSGSKKSAAEAEDPNKVVLFDGTLNNWTFYLRDSLVAPETVFTVIDDTIINIKGDPFGYMRTNEVYSNYTLHVEYRYPYEMTNSGIFVHVQDNDTIWPVCIENQLSAGKNGDFVLMNGASIAEVDSTKKASGARIISVTKLAESVEKGVGEWNVMEITCSGTDITNYVNGVLMNKGTESSLTSGHIALQSEGKDIQFKNVYLIKL